MSKNNIISELVSEYRGELKKLPPPIHGDLRAAMLIGMKNFACVFDLDHRHVRAAIEIIGEDIPIFVGEHFSFFATAKGPILHTHRTFRGNFLDADNTYRNFMAPEILSDLIEFHHFLSNKTKCRNTVERTKDEIIARMEDRMLKSTSHD